MNMFGFSNGGKRSHGFLLLLAVVFFLSGFLTSPLVSLLKCSSPVKQLESLPPIRIHKAASALDPITDWSLTDLVLFRTKCGEPIRQEDAKTLLLNKVFDGISPFVEFPPELAKPYLREKRIRGWGSTGAVFARLVEEVKPKIILELGSYLGASAIHMATLAKSTFDHQVFIICVDDFRGWPGFRDKFKFHQTNGDVQLLYQFMQNVQTMNFTGNILPLPFSTTSAMSALCEWGVYADLIEVDAAHDFHSAWADINLGYSLLKPGGVMFGHDYYTKLDNRGVGRAVDLFARLKGLRVEPDGQHWILRSK
ncbi:hypothetical protein GOP47_0012011 [Adiantum capillus-veneris]|uniref:S-adenosyl-L-methionine-dependent methyltransferase n=1 Tax=Adiantum capillus-veneris TaxID=13818 RepID=A0A9D4UV02_ADICA|nr:hypothetical protein GOP47_0012011 [Adiantum capillus-veneris]